MFKMILDMRRGGISCGFRFFRRVQMPSVSSDPSASLLIHNAGLSASTGYQCFISAMQKNRRKIWNLRGQGHSNMGRGRIVFFFYYLGYWELLYLITFYGRLLVLWWDYRKQETKHGECLDVYHIQADQSDLVLLVWPGRYGSRLPVGVRGDIS